MLLTNLAVTAFANRQRHIINGPADLANARHAVSVLLHTGLCEAPERDTLWNIADRIDDRIRRRWEQIPQPALALYARDEIPA